MSIDFLFWFIGSAGAIGIGLKIYQLFFQKQKVLGVIEVVSTEEMQKRLEAVKQPEQVFPDNFKSYVG